MYIAYLLHAPHYLSGGTRIIYEHVNRLAVSGHRVELWVPETNGKPPFTNAVPAQLLDATKLDEPDIVVMCDPAFLEIVCAKRTRGGTFLLLQHDIELVAEEAAKQIYANIMQEVKNYVQSGNCSLLVVSPWLQQQVKKRYGLNSVLIENGINQDIFHPAAPFVRTGRPSVLTIFDPQPWKGADKAMATLLEVHKRVPDLEVFILSKGLITPPQERALTYVFPFPVTIFCNPPQERLAAIYASGDVFLSTSQAEGFGLPVLESFACGTAVSTTDNGGNRGFAINGETALIIPGDNVRDAADRVENLLTDKALRDQLRKKALRKAKHYSWDRTVKKLEEVFKG